MESLPQAATIAVVVIGLASVLLARMPVFRQDFRRSASFAVGIVSLLTLLLSLNVLLTGLRLHESASGHDLALINGLVLAGLVLMLVSALAFFFSLGVLIWTLGPAQPRSSGAADGSLSAAHPAEPYSP